MCTEMWWRFPRCVLSFLSPWGSASGVWVIIDLIDYIISSVAFIVINRRMELYSSSYDRFITILYYILYIVGESQQIFNLLYDIVRQTCRWISVNDINNSNTIYDNSLWYGTTLFAKILGTRKIVCNVHGSFSCTLQIYTDWKS